MIPKGEGREGRGEKREEEWRGEEGGEGARGGRRRRKRRGRVWGKFFAGKLQSPRGVGVREKAVI